MPFNAMLKSCLPFSSLLQQYPLRTPCKKALRVQVALCHSSGTAVTSMG